MVKKDAQISIRCSSTDKEKAKAIIDQYNKNWDFVLEFFLGCFNEATGSLKIEKQILQRELESDMKDLKLKEFEIKNKELRLKTIDETIKNTSEHNIDDYKYNTAMMGAVESIKEMLFNPHSNYESVEEIPENVFKTKAKNFKLKNVELLKSIVKEEYSKNWKKEISNSISENESKEQKLKDLETNVLSSFNRPSQRKNNLFEFIEDDKERITSRCNQKHIRFEDLIEHLENLPDEKKHK